MGAPSDVKETPSPRSQRMAGAPHYVERAAAGSLAFLAGRYPDGRCGLWSGIISFF
jgi:hypothetical protein